MPLPHQIVSAIDKAAEALPECLRAEFKPRWQAFVDHDVELPGVASEIIESLPRVWVASEFVYHACMRDAGLLPWLFEDGALLQAEMPGVIRARVQDALSQVSDEATLKKALRIVRRREMVRIIWRDLAGWADLAEVVGALSELADSACAGALAWLDHDARSRFGTPVGVDSGKDISLCVIAMGKLGANELNLSSDIDLVFAYAEEGETAGGARTLSNHEYFVKLGKRLIAALNDSTEDGFVFRVDMRLRPNGSAGPLALCFEAMEHYFEIHGREWERYAWIKARVIAGDLESGAELLAMLQPFVYRKYIDFGAVESIREMKAMISQEMQRKSMAHNIKLGPGGIREIEFIGQAFQLIRGGRDRALRTRQIQRVLPLLAEREHITERCRNDLLAAYEFLRRVEHRLQAWRDEQTQQLPEDDAGQARLACAMGYADWNEFGEALKHHQRRVDGHFQQLFSAPQSEAHVGDEGLRAIWRGLIDAQAADEIMQALGYGEPAQAQALINGLREGAAYTGFSRAGRERMDRLMPLIVRACALLPAPETVLARVTQILEAIGRRSAYVSLLIENPMALSQLVKLAAASDWIANWIARHPILLDELLNPTVLYGPIDAAGLKAELGEIIAVLDSEDLEAQMERLREFRHARVLRVAAADIGPGLEPEEVAERLAAIAETVLDRSLQLASDALVRKHGQPACTETVEDHLPPFAVIAYGKLGGRELSYGSDLDLVFLYGACEGGETAGGEGRRAVPNETFFARLGQRLIHILSTRTPGGILYEVDMRLRPSGESGPLVSSAAAFARYQQDKAWVWEHQALVRARAVAGHSAVITHFNEIRHEILCQSRDEAKLKREVSAMREKMRTSLLPADVEGFHLKQGAGGIVDIEFLVQYWVLRFAAQNPGIVAHTENSALLLVLARAGHIDDAVAADLRHAYRHYLATEYRMKLTAGGPGVDLESLGEHPERVRALWQAVFGD